MAEYSKEEIKKIEQKWQEKWEKEGAYKVSDTSDKPKYYVLDMFPYPSGAGLHVGHPLGYIASDIVSRYKRSKGFNVLHPMGFDAFGLPAEQYAIQTGQHPAVTTAKNIETYKRQLRQIGFSYDWSREVQTCEPAYYKWTQWIFMQLFNAWYNKKSIDNGQLTIEGKTENISTLIAELEKNGNASIDAVCDDETPEVTAEEWKNFNEKEKEEFLQHYRIAYQSETMVNWCAALGTVLSNDEVKDGVSERGGYPVERIKMLQWSMRITAYAERLLKGLDTIDWPEPVKEMQRNWIGKSLGCQFKFEISNSKFQIEVFTTRIDTAFGVTFLVLAPEHELVKQITTDAQRNAVEAYVEVAKNRSERERMSEVKRVSGAFTGAFAVNPFNGEQIPIWISDYVLAGYGTGAVMAVPGHDERDHRFAKHFNLPIRQVVEGPSVQEEVFVSWDAKIINSDFMNGLTVDEAIAAGIKKVEALKIGKGKVNFRLRDAIFGRQRYWGEPFPVYYKDGLPKLVAEKDLPITLPEIDEYKPTESGEPPLARAKGWSYQPHPQPLSKGEGGKWETSEKKYWHLLKTFAKDNRKNQTEAEATIWNEVRDSKLGHKIRRQHTIGTFIADFVCVDKGLVIEIDGEYHEQQKEYDQARTEFLESEGFSVIRFTNDDVKKNLENVLTSIKNKLNTLSSITSPSPVEKGPGDEAQAYPFELTTMPGWAGSSWYWFRYMDPKNDEAFASKEKTSYWKDVDLYIGGSEHATGHLLYSRFWCKALKDLGFVEAEEPFKKLINQGHIQGVTKFVYRASFIIGKTIDGEWRGQTIPLLLISKKYADDFEKAILSDSDKKSLLDRALLHYKKSNNLLDDINIEIREINAVQPIRIKTQLADSTNPSGGWILDVPAFKNWSTEFWPESNTLDFFLEGDYYICGAEVDKMSKRYYNDVRPDDIVSNYGADTLRLYEMFLGPLELSKPWNTQGIDGVYKFLRRFWNLFHDKNGNFNITEEAATREELKVLHKTIKKVAHDIENFSFNTSVSEFMICSNELSSMKCNKRSILEPLCIVLAPYAPHIAETLWFKLTYNGVHDLELIPVDYLSTKSVLLQEFPLHNEEYLTESSHEYPISINGKVRGKMNFALDMPKEDIEKIVLASETVQKWSEGKTPKKIIVVQGKIVNVVL
jgi:leucyl-tRNA synthetase